MATTSLARPYAKAVFELAQENKAVSAWSQALSNLAVLSEDKDFERTINDPRISKSQLVELIESVCEGQSVDGLSNFIKLAVQNNRLESLVTIKQLFDEYVAKADASINAQVSTAMALSEKQKEALSSALEKRLGLKVNLEEVVDKDLIGGAIIKAGDLVIDGSAKGRIEKLASILAR